MLAADGLVQRPIAHRGLHDMLRGQQRGALGGRDRVRRPENSLAAFKAAMERGYAIECDLQPSREGEPMVFHDESLRRLTGAEGQIRQSSLAEISLLRLLGTEEGVPSLQELLDLVVGRVPLVLELKSVAGENAGFAERVAAVLAGYDGPVGVMSFDPLLLQDVRRAGLEAPVGLTLTGEAESVAAHLATMARLKLDFASCRLADLAHFAPAYRELHQDRALISWTVRSPAEAEASRRHGAQITFEGFLP
ncbi:glycerophosphodiester phosphodiesterase family protein [Afifella pfennigii]|uniref:glycerophosphodiester phosphodiesterase family protein n=1 Tax=Afifella pfennigii TaxID=209897 RepID=UPI00047BA580|nr:glycerophosphodiester phosphodiesterase family protein [Afifella pfennigii]